MSAPVEPSAEPVAGDGQRETCGTCERPTATQSDFDRFEGRAGGNHLCFREYGGDCEPVDWAARFDALSRAVQAFAGLDDGAFEAVTPEAMRAVLARHGWEFVRSVLSEAVLTQGEIRADRYLFSDGVTWTLVPVIRNDTYRFLVKQWAEIVAGAPDPRLAPAQVLAEALAEVDR